MDTARQGGVLSKSAIRILNHKFELQKAISSEDFSSIKHNRYAALGFAFYATTATEPIALATESESKGPPKKLQQLAISGALFIKKAIRGYASRVLAFRDQPPALATPATLTKLLRSQNEVLKKDINVELDGITEQAIVVIERLPLEAQDDAADAYFKYMDYVTDATQVAINEQAEVLQKVYQFLQGSWIGVRSVSNVVEVAADGAIDAIKELTGVPAKHSELGLPGQKLQMSLGKAFDTVEGEFLMANQTHMRTLRDQIPSQETLDKVLTSVKSLRAMVEKLLADARLDDLMTTSKDGGDAKAERRSL